MFSFAGDVVLDPFAGTCATAIAAFNAGRNSVSNEIDPTYIELGLSNLKVATSERPLFGAAQGNILIDWAASNGRKTKYAKRRQ